MNGLIFYFIGGVLFLVAMLLAFVGVAIRNRIKDFGFIEETFEPRRPSVMKVWNCKRKKHEGNAWRFIERHDGCDKFYCWGCGTVFLKGKLRIRRIKIVG